ncbi:hypothetical protein AAC387_Pa05g0690 [Persea americana]
MWSCWSYFLENESYFSKHVGVRDSNEADLLTILEGLILFSRGYGVPLVLKSGSSNTIDWVSKQKASPWKLQLHFNEIWELAASIKVSFYHKSKSADSMVDVLARQGVDRILGLE